MKVVLHDCAKASREGHGAQVELVLVLELAPLDDGGARARRPGCPGVSVPVESSAVAVIVFMLEPGGNWPFSALPASAASLEETARISPVPGRTTTRCVGSCCAGDGGVGGVLQRGDQRRLQRACPAPASTAAISRPSSGVPSSVLTTDTVNPGVPASCSWNARCSPERPELVAGGVARRPVVLGLLDDLGGGLARRGPAGLRRSGRSAPAVECRSGTPRRAGRTPGRGSSRSPAGAG